MASHHPYPNGNGRTARTWANWVATRYRLPPDFVGDHDLTISIFVDLLRLQLP